MTERQISEREAIVRAAIVSLSKVGMKIESLAVHPLTFREMVAEWPTAVSLVRDSTALPQHTYCGIPVNQVT